MVHANGRQGVERKGEAATEGTFQLSVYGSNLLLTAFSCKTKLPLVRPWVYLSQRFEEKRHLWMNLILPWTRMRGITSRPCWRGTETLQNRRIER